MSQYDFDDLISALEYHVPHSQHQHDLMERIAPELRELLFNDELLPDDYVNALINGEIDGRIYTSPEHGFFVQVFAWPPGVSTPVHDHKTWGMMGVYYNQLRITEFAAEQTSAETWQLHEKADFLGRRGTLAAITSPDDELHRIENPSSDYSFSVHVYGAELWQTENYDFATQRFYQG